MSGRGPVWEAAADLVIVGGGVAGLAAAHAAEAAGLRVLTLSKGAAEADTSTYYAQGGIAVPLNAADVAEHLADTVTAGAGLVDVAAAQSILSAGREALASLQALGAAFDSGPDGVLLRTREGGHGVRRIVHAGGDATGAEVQRALAKGQVVLAGHTALWVLRDDSGVTGVLATDGEGRVGVLAAPVVLIATGGSGQVFSVTTNPSGATGDGLALALRAGAPLADMEFIQFHPTMLYTGAARGRQPLVSEAVRGEGAVLMDSAGARLMLGRHPLADLAPRDVVARVIAEYLRATGERHVWLDCSAVENFETRFPTVYAACLAAGISPLSGPVPVAPGAHYQCGGVMTDAWGRTPVAGLYAAGEVARTGLHGANRLASNSLLEGLVVGARVGNLAASQVRKAAAPTVEPAHLSASLEAVGSLVTDAMANIPTLMSQQVGVLRDAEGLADAADTLAAAALAAGPGCADTLLPSRVITAAALARAESRGSHTRLDFPDSEPALAHSRVITLRDGAIAVHDLTGARR